MASQIQNAPTVTGAPMTTSHRNHAHPGGHQVERAQDRQQLRGGVRPRARFQCPRRDGGDSLGLGAPPGAKEDMGQSEVADPSQQRITAALGRQIGTLGGQPSEVCGSKLG